MRKRKLRTFLIVGVLFFLPACGIPRMFPWREGYQYDLSYSSITFNLNFRDTEESQVKFHKPRIDTPVFRLYYYVDTLFNDPSISDVGSSLRSRFRSRYAGSFPPTFEDGDAAATVTLTDRGNNDETIRISAYEVTVIPPEGGTPVPISSYFAGVESFEPHGHVNSEGYADSYSATYSFRKTSVNDYYIEMTYNGQTYLLARMNGEPFSDSSKDVYFNPDNGDAEFLPDDEDAFIGIPRVHLFGAVSFAFEGYTTRQTVLLDEIDLI